MKNVTDFRKTVETGVDPRPNVLSRNALRCVTERGYKHYTFAGL